MFEPVPPFLASEFQIKYVTERWERDAAEALRRQVFCDEQKIFVADDRDDIDDDCISIVALSLWGIAADSVVGTVRIHEDSPGIWWGSRLAVARPYRRMGALGSALIKLAVSSAHARGCARFLAYVQSQNEPLFRSLHWDALSKTELHGRPHFKMEADLGYYPPFLTPETGFVALPRQIA